MICLHHSRLAWSEQGVEGEEEEEVVLLLFKAAAVAPHQTGGDSIPKNPQASRVRITITGANVTCRCLAASLQRLSGFYCEDGSSPLTSFPLPSTTAAARRC